MGKGGRVSKMEGESKRKGGRERKRERGIERERERRESHLHSTKNNNFFTIIHTSCSMSDEENSLES